MQKIAFRQLLLICVILLLPSTGRAAQQTWLGCDFANIIAGVTVAGVASRTAYAAACFALAQDNITYSFGESSDYRKGNPIPFALDIVKKGFYPALGVGAFTAVAACSGSWRQLEVKDAVKPAIYAFGALFLAKIPCIYYGRKYGYGGLSFDMSKRSDWLRFDRSYLGSYATALITVGVPLHVLYQRYNQH